MGKKRKRDTAVHMRRSPVVLMNVLSLEGNPYLDLWCRAARQGGATLRRLSWRSAMGFDGGRADWIHIQWPEFALQGKSTFRAVRSMGILLISLGAGRLVGARVVLTAHNLRSHDGRHPRLEELMLRLLGLLVTDLHAMTEAGGRVFIFTHPQFRRARVHVIPHGDYRPVAEARSQVEARQELGIPKEANVYLTFGAMRSYKGAASLLALLSAPWPSDTIFVITGAAEGDTARRLRDLHEQERGVHVMFHEGFLPQEALSTYICAADWVLLPYRNVLNSGSLLLALTLGRPVVVPDTPTFREIGERVSGGWVRCYSGALTADEVVELTAEPPSGVPNLEWCSWTEVTRLQERMFASAKSAR